jgi:putative FmdB family regulatory protein
MPIYEYVCQDCGVETEIMQRISDAPETDCPSCGKAALTKVVSAAGFRLSGGGWYETDFKSGNKKNLTADKADSSGPACTPTGCDKPACAAKTDAAA